MESGGLRPKLCATLCYMSESDIVGIRELRQNLSKYLRRVARGETLRVSDRGRPVAILAPLPGEATVVDRLVARGRLTRARVDLRALASPEAEPVEASISDALEQERGED